MSVFTPLPQHPDHPALERDVLAWWDRERIFMELPDVPFRDHVWAPFLRENAMRVFKLDD